MQGCNNFQNKFVSDDSIQTDLCFWTIFLSVNHFNLAKVLKNIEARHSTQDNPNPTYFIHLDLSLRLQVNFMYLLGMHNMTHEVHDRPKDHP